MALTDICAWIDEQDQARQELLRDLVAINTHTQHLSGIQQALDRITTHLKDEDFILAAVPLPEFEMIGSHGQPVKQQLAPGLKIQSRPNSQATRRIFFMIHVDTVLPAPGMAVDIKEEAGCLFAPGAADAKGGIVVMLTVLQALARTDWGNKFAWTAFINTDEEIASPGSREILPELAQGHDVGFIFEPALPNGALVSERKGSGNFTLVVRGRAAHAGRSIEEGRNAVNALAAAVRSIQELTGKRPNLTANVGLIQGGHAVNMVPDLALARFNIRIAKAEDEAFVWVELKQIIAELEKTEGITAELHGAFFAPPKAFDALTQALFENLQTVGKDLGMPIQWQPSGGVCDGNRLAACGVPNIDTLGVHGDRLHSPDEFMELKSLTAQSKLVVSFLHALAHNQEKKA